MVAFLQDMVRIPSVNGRHPEKAVAQRIVAEAAKLNLSVQLIAADPERPNVLVQWGKGAAGNAHAPDEWVEIASLTTTMATFAGIICDYLATMFAM